jgi:AraC-like DNA-binding protein
MTPKNPLAVEELFKSAERAYTKGELLRCTAKLYELFAIVKKEKESEYTPSVRAQMIEPAIKRIAEMKAGHTPTVGELAALCEISEGYLRSLFLSVLGQSPTEYISTVKINRAKELIRSGLCPISEAARSVGFEDIAYFSRVFKKIVGISPREYKNSSV